MIKKHYFAGISIPFQPTALKFISDNEQDNIIYERHYFIIKNLEINFLTTLIMNHTPIYFKDNYLVIENSIMLEKIDVKSFDDIIIFYEFPGRKYKLNMFFTSPVKYEAKKGFINKIICSVFNHNNNPYEIKQTYYDINVERLLVMIKQCLTYADIPDLKNSIYWRTEDGKNIFQRTKLIYSKDNLSLTNVLKKHKIITNE
ncbi:MAG: hypothetical protein MUW56_07370 [Chryseobacterium sp.]|uniref:hypothetical protein n=1 Tax=Chryseobacterium sp. TaxID=1871047 RepID=UPI0025BED206|nr:hypothetical protein [Chryseobacterium sp.]MCJ7933445.1 hypothetical protein [Chryseobacterium sp.]